MALPTRHTHRMEDLTLWSAAVPVRVTANEHGRSTQPNPLIVGDLVLVSIFGPGALYAFDRRSGQLVWSVPIGEYGGSHAVVAERLVYGFSSTHIVAADLASGAPVWARRPSADIVYSAPTIASGRVFLGDVAGRMVCLNAATGETLWQRTVSHSMRRRVNATALVTGGLVISATVDGRAFALSVADGAQVWQRQLARHCHSDVLLYEGSALVRATQSLYALDPQNGEVRRRWTWPGREIRTAEVAEDALVVVTTRAYGMRDPPPGWKPRYLPQDLRAIRDGRQAYRRDHPLYGGHIRYSTDSGLLYEDNYQGLGILDPTTGERLHVIAQPESKQVPPDYGSFALPDTARGLIYALSSKGVVTALRHP